MSRSLLLVVLLCLFVAPTSSQQYRACWISIYRSMTSPTEAATTFSFLKSIGITDVYVNVWNQGKVYYNSPSVTNALGAGAQGVRDQLRLALDAARPHGIKVWAWYEYGLMSAHKSSPDTAFAVYARNRGWELGFYSQWYWVDPTKTAVLDFIANMLIDAKKNYPELTGLQLDDHFAYPVALSAPGRYTVMNTAAKYITDKIKAAVPGTLLSISPNTLNAAESTYNVRWTDWISGGYFNEYAPQLYREQASQFETELGITRNRINPVNYPKLIAGVRLNGDSGPTTTWANFNAMVNSPNLRGFKGVCVWFVDGMIGIYPNQLRQLWAPKTTVPPSNNPGLEYYCGTGSPSLNVRSTASTSGTVVGSIPYGEAAASVSCCTAAGGVSWRRVTYNGVTGYAADSYLRRCNPAGQYTVTNSSDQDFSGDCLPPPADLESSDEQPSAVSMILAPIAAILALLLVVL